MENAVRSPTQYVEEHKEANRAWLDALYAKEEEVRPSFTAFEKFFGDMFRCGVLRPVRPALGIKLVFAVDESEHTSYWSANFRTGRVECLDEEPRDTTCLIRVHPAVLADALETFTFTNIDISKRWRVAVRSGGETKVLISLVLIALYEAGYLKLSNVLSWRFAAGMFARRGEVLDYLGLIFTVLTRDAKAAASAVTKPL